MANRSVGLSVADEAMGMELVEDKIDLTSHEKQEDGKVLITSFPNFKFQFSEPFRPQIRNVISY